MKTILWSTLCCLLFGWGSVQTVSAQDLEKMEKNLSAINAELGRKTKEYSWLLASAYADYCEANNSFISWKELPYLQTVVEFERPAVLETLRLEADSCRKALSAFLNTYKEYRELQKRKAEAVAKAEKEEVSAARTAFLQKLQGEDTPYRELYYASRKAGSKYRSEALRYVIAHYKEKGQEMPTSYIKYSERSDLLQKGSAVELLQQEISALESVRQTLVRQIAEVKYGVGETGKEQ